jgi:hypothetical protein
MVVALAIGCVTVVLLVLLVLCCCCQWYVAEVEVVDIDIVDARSASGDIGVDIYVGAIFNIGVVVFCVVVVVVVADAVAAVVAVSMVVDMLASR